MKTKLQTITIILIAALGIWSCSKNDDRDPGKGNDGKGNLPAKLIYTFTRDVYYPDLRTNRQSTYFTFNTYGFNFWDIGRDGQFRLTSEREAGVFDVAQITLIHNSDGTISDEFDYDSPKGSDTNVQVLLSPDNKKVLYSPTLANGIVITDLDGNVLTPFGSCEHPNGTCITWNKRRSAVASRQPYYIYVGWPVYLPIRPSI